MSIFARIEQIENQMASIENAINGVGKANSTAAPKGTVSAQDAASFQSIIGSMTDGSRFNPSSVGHTSSISGGVAGNSDKYDDIINEAAQKYNVEPALIKAVVRQESAFDPQATSYCGAQGLMQLMPETASDLGVKDAYDPRENIMGGAKYLSQLKTMFNGDLTKTIAAYNAGPGNVQSYGGVPPFQETQNYVDKVLGYYQENKGIRS